jgi:hypothetical protein
MSTVRPLNQQSLNSKSSNLSKASNVTDSLVDRDRDRYTSNANITPIKEYVTGDDSTTKDTTPGQALTTDKRDERPISDMSFGNYSFKSPNRLSQNTNMSLPASVSGDRVVQTYSTLLQLMKEADQQALAASALAQSMGSSAISPSHAQPMASSPLNPNAASFHAANPAKSAIRSFSTPLGPHSSSTKRHVSIRPPPLRSSPLQTTFIAPAEYTPYPTVNVGNNQHSATKAIRHSFPLLTNRASGWHQLTDSPCSPTTPIVTLPLTLHRRHTTRTSQIYLPSGFDSAFARSTASDPAATASTASFHSRLATPAQAAPEVSAELASLHFDDEEFFLAMRRAYYTELLDGSKLGRLWRRYGSARCLRRVRYVPDPLASVGLGLTLTLGAEEPKAPSEQEMMQLFLKPKHGKGRFDTVRWAWSVACGGGSTNAFAGGFEGDDIFANEDGVKQGANVQTLPLDLYPRPAAMARGSVEFEEGWAVWRIVFGVLVVMIATVAMVLCWTLVGVEGGGDAGRVQEAFVMGLVVLLVGGLNLGAWLGGSWIVT